MSHGVVETNLLRLKNDIVPYTPRIIAVTKYYDLSAIIEAYKAGLRDFGESRANDAIEKIKSLPLDIRRESKFHFIGHLQTNKAARVVQYFDYIQSVDSLRLAEVLSENAEKIGKIQDVLLQVNISEEVQKYGFKVEELESCICELKNLKGLRINGLMCMAPLGADDALLDNVFSSARNLKDRLNQEYEMDLKELSMGMSDDYSRAVVNGATMIRVGRLLFN